MTRKQGRTKRRACARRNAPAKSKITNFDSIKGFYAQLTANQIRFIAAYGECGNVTGAAEVARLTRQCHYQWLSQPEYQEAFAAAREVAVERLEAEARRRALAGSDVLLIFLMKALRPDVYRDTHSLHLQAKVAHDVTRKPGEEGMTDNERIRRIQVLAERIRERRHGLPDTTGAR